MVVYEHEGEIFQPVLSSYISFKLFFKHPQNYILHLNTWTKLLFGTKKSSSSM